MIKDEIKLTNERSGLLALISDMDHTKIEPFGLLFYFIFYIYYNKGFAMLTYKVFKI